MDLAANTVRATPPLTDECASVLLVLDPVVRDEQRMR